MPELPKQPYDTSNDWKARIYLLLSQKGTQEMTTIRMQGPYTCTVPLLIILNHQIDSRLT